MFVIVGGGISAGTAYFLEKFRRGQQRRDKLNDARRSALAQALEWLNPMENALAGAEIEIYALLSGSVDEQVFRRRYPNLLSELSDLDLSPEQQLVLDDNPYQLGNQIRRAVQDLKYKAIEEWGNTRYPVDSPALSVVDARYNATVRVKELKQQVEALRQRLAEQYRKTYE